MSDSPNCPQCGSINTYSMGSIFVCPDCFYEWNPDFENEGSVDEMIKVF